MALHHVASERSSRRRRQFQIYGRPRREQGEGSARHRFRSQVGMKAAGLDIQRGQAHPADRDAVAGAQRDAMTVARQWQSACEPSRCSTARTVPVVSISPVNISASIRSLPTRDRGGRLRTRNPGQTVSANSSQSAGSPSIELSIGTAVLPQKRGRIKQHEFIHQALVEG